MQLDAIKKQMNRRRKASEDDSILVAYDTLFDIFFMDTTYRGSIFGTEESIKTIKKKDIENFYKNHFVGNNMIVAVSTDLEEEAILNLITKFFKKFPCLNYSCFNEKFRKISTSCDILLEAV